MAHIKDSPIQAHSVGELFPFVLYRQTVNGKDTWSIVGPQYLAEGFKSRAAAELVAAIVKILFINGGVK